MSTEERVLIRRQLDKRLTPLRQSQGVARPPRGWIRAIRYALGMTTKQFAVRLGVSQPRITQLEQAEPNGSITLNTLQRAANALDCQLVYALVPRRPLQELIEERAAMCARRIMDAKSQSMAPEGQRADADDELPQLEQLIDELSNSEGSSLWEDE